MNLRLQKLTTLEWAAKLKEKIQVKHNRMLVPWNGWRLNQFWSNQKKKITNFLFFLIHPFILMLFLFLFFWIFLFFNTFNSRVYSEKTDVWAFGITMIEILTRAPPYGSKNSAAVVALGIVFCFFFVKKKILICWFPSLFFFVYNWNSMFWWIGSYNSKQRKSDSRKIAKIMFWIQTGFSPWFQEDRKFWGINRIDYFLN